jgi:hypothetical protein
MTIVILGPGILYGQEWSFQKERDGIRIYTKEEEGSKLKAFRGEAIIHTSMDEIFPVLSDPLESDWWDEDLKSLDVISYKPGVSSAYYLVYDVQWPFSDRDLYVESEISHDTVNGKALVSTRSVAGVIPEKPDLERISNFRQKWIAEERGDSAVYLVLEGFTDPGGNIPSWLLNSIVGSTPMKLFRNLKEKLE